MGQVHYGVTEAGRKFLVYRRSLYVTQDIAAGEPFSVANLRAIRPGLGSPPNTLKPFWAAAPT